jgi:hypothetical protein
MFLSFFWQARYFVMGNVSLRKKTIILSAFGACVAVVGFVMGFYGIVAIAKDQINEVRSELPERYFVQYFSDTLRSAKPRKSFIFMCRSLF